MSLSGPSDKNQVQVLPGRRKGSLSFWFDGHQLHEQGAYRRCKGVIIGFCCKRQRQDHCHYSLIIKGDANDDSADYISSNEHACKRDEDGYAKALFLKELNRTVWADAWKNNKDRLTEHYESVKDELRVSGCDLPSLDEIYKTMTRKRCRGTEMQDFEDEQPMIKIPARRFSAEELQRQEEERERGRVEEARIRANAYQELLRVRQRRAQLTEKVERCRKQKQAILEMMSPNFAVPVRVPPQPQFQVVSDDGDLQELKPITILPKLDYLKGARPGRVFPETEECYVCSDGPSRATFLLCGKVSMCANCAVKVQLEFQRCTCCNNPGVKDCDGNPIFQIVK